MTPESAIHALLDRYADAHRDKDSAAIVSCYAEDTVAFELAPPLAIAPENTRNPAYWDEWFSTWTSPIELEMHEPKLDISGDLAVSYALVRMTGERTEGVSTDMWFRSTLVLGRLYGEWKIVHTHNSVPLAMDGTGRALVDLTPDETESKGA